MLIERMSKIQIFCHHYHPLLERRRDRSLSRNLIGRSIDSRISMPRITNADYRLSKLVRFDIVERHNLK